ncbi:MAG: hypothetical protein K5927_09935 [Lachnospiraceae bacterium]|nr:hypothetical protein [Lachnospiraceae bacterium]
MIGIRDKNHIKILCRIIVYICAYLCVIGHLADATLDENNVSAEVITYPDYSHLFEAFDVHERTSVKTV